jgi:hypothetical protein
VVDADEDASTGEDVGTTGENNGATTADDIDAVGINGSAIDVDGDGGTTEVVTKLGDNGATVSVEESTVVDAAIDELVKNVATKGLTVGKDAPPETSEVGPITTSVDSVTLEKTGKSTDGGEDNDVAEGIKKSSGIDDDPGIGDTVKNEEELILFSIAVDAPWETRGFKVTSATNHKICEADDIFSWICL